MALTIAIYIRPEKQHIYSYLHKLQHLTQRAFDGISAFV